MSEPVLSAVEGIAAIGRRHFVGCFASVGARVVPCQTAQAFADAAAALVAGGSEKGTGTFCPKGPKGASPKTYLSPFPTPTLVLLDQHFAACEGAIGALRRRGTVVILLPAESVEGHPALDEMRALIELAAGANILGEY